MVTLDNHRLKWLIDPQKLQMSLDYPESWIWSDCFCCFGQCFCYDYCSCCCRWWCCCLIDVVGESVVFALAGIQSQCNRTDVDGQLVFPMEQLACKVEPFLVTIIFVICFCRWCPWDIWCRNKRDRCCSQSRTGSRCGSRTGSETITWVLASI